MHPVTPSRAATLSRKLIEADIPVFIWGPPGIGKSEMVAQLAAEDGAELIDIRLSMFDPVDLRGLPVPQGDVAKWLRPSVLPSSDQLTYFFLDELDRAAPAVQSAALQLVLNRCVGEHKLPDNVRIIAAGNGSTDRIGTNKTSGASDNRFAHLFMEPDVESWTQWAANNGITPELVAFINFRPDLLHDMSDKNAKSKPTPRSWVKASPFINDEDLRYDLTRANVGDGPASEFEAFMRVFRSIPSLDAIITDPHHAAIPDEMSAKYAVTFGLAARADGLNFSNIVAYAKRLPVEFGVSLVNEAGRRKPEVTHTQAYTSFLAENSGVIL